MMSSLNQKQPYPRLRKGSDQIKAFFEGSAAPLKPVLTTSSILRERASSGSFNNDKKPNSSNEKVDYPTRPTSRQKESFKGSRGGDSKETSFLAPPALEGPARDNSKQQFRDLSFSSVQSDKKKRRSRIVRALVSKLGGRLGRFTGRSRKETQQDDKSQALPPPTIKAPTRIMAMQPKFSLEADRDWHVQQQHNLKVPLKIENPVLRHNIFVRDCSNMTLQVSKKFNNLTLEKCENVNIVVENVISSIDVVHCKKCKIQILKSAYAVTLDNSYSIDIYASYQSRGLQLTTSLIAEVNLHVPPSADSQDDWVEIPVPCQFMHSLSPDSNTLNSRVSDLYH